ncbi:hypothetical protein DIS24_g3958 [Lasiodiplodia hormozganensis]|uniref:Uncharacterized protein n=1 Tax=Lasiodiplodia hormozganensis TaxID=869390 RepID=A0AA39YVU1_9PEZI|nr:hypothetical protein DIS24_g3958 [Lasiodiplodia hormozganensis]
MELTSTSPESAMTAKESDNILVRTSSPMSDSNESSKDSQDILTKSKAATPTFMGLPTELRQRILYLVLSTLAPMSPDNGSYVAQLESSRSTRIRQIRHFTPTAREASNIERLLQARPRRRFFTWNEVASYLHMQNLYLINRTVRFEMRFVEQAWLEQYKPRRAAPLSLGAFAAWAAAPTPVNGILTLSLFDRNFIAHPPPEWEPVVRSIAADRWAYGGSDSHWRSDEYLRAWREVIKMLPQLEGGDREATVARRYGIEAVEIVGVMRCVLTPRNYLMEGMGLVHNTEIAWLEIMLMMRWGLKQGRVRVMT